MQEVFLRLVRTSPVFRDGEHCKAWLLRVTVNCAELMIPFEENTAGEAYWLDEVP